MIFRATRNRPVGDPDRRAWGHGAIRAPRKTVHVLFLGPLCIVVAR